MNRYLVLMVYLSLGLTGPLARSEMPTEYALDNELRVRLVPSAGEKQAVVLLGVRAGFMEEPAGVPHLAHVTEHLTVFDLPPRETNAVKEWFTTKLRGS